MKILDFENIWEMEEQQRKTLKMKRKYVVKDENIE